MARAFTGYDARMTLATPTHDVTIYGALARQYLAVRETYRDSSASAFNHADMAMHDALRLEWESRRDVDEQQAASERFVGC